MCVEGIGDFEVVGYEGLECLASDVSGSWEGLGDGDIGATVFWIIGGSSDQLLYGTTYAEK